MPYVTWEYYSSLYSISDVPEFERLLKLAAAKLDRYTHGRARMFEDAYREDMATPFQRLVHDQIINTVCDLMHLMQVQDESGAGTGLASVSNDGYTETYKITTAADQEVQLVSALRSGLSGTGLAGAL